MRRRNPPKRIKGRDPQPTPSNRLTALLPAVVGVAALVVTAIVFTGATTSSRVAQNAESLHWANAMLGSSEIARLAVGQAVQVADNDASEPEQIDEALAEARFAIDTARYWAARPEADVVAVNGVGPLLDAAGNAVTALEDGDVDVALATLQNDFEPARADAVAGLNAAQNSAAEQIEQTEASAGYVATVLQFVMVLLVPATALFLYRRRAKAQLKEETIRMDAQLETHRAVAEAKDNLIAAVSHELRTPLTSISGFAEILEDDENLSPAQRDMVEVINGEAKELARMVEDFLVAARFDHAVADLETTDIEVMRTIAPLLGAAEASGREVQIDPRSLWVKGEQDRIVHITRNLISNAVAHGGPQIRATIVRGDESSRLVIADNGPGIPLEANESLFEPFVNEGARALVTGSLGMGLAVARELAREMEGDLTLERTVDGWTCFSLTLRNGVPADESAAPTEQLVA